MNHLSVRSRLIALVLGMAALLVLVGGLGFHSTNSAIRNLEDTYSHQTIPMREVARLRRLHVENESHVFKAFQHNPQFEYAKLHNHPLSAHTDAVEKNLIWAEETWKDLLAHLPPDGEDTRIAKEIQPLYVEFVEKALKPVLSQLKSGNYSADAVAAFLKANNELGVAMDKAFRKLAEAQQNSVKSKFESATAQADKLRNLSVAAIVVGVSLGLGIAFLIVRSIVRPLAEMQAVIDRAANNNDFTGTIDIGGRDEIAHTAQSFNQMMATLRTSLNAIKQSMIRVDDALQALSAAAEQAASASTSTSESASAMAASVEQMSVSITSVSDSTNEALNIAKTAGERANTGGQVIDGTVAEIGQIAALVEKVSDTITDLGKSSDRISTIVQVIKDVADQTNLLALNAAIEAARAGEAGRGFAVVADEVRKLAERTTTATGEIAEMIANIQNTSRSAVDIMSDTVNRVGKGAEHAQAAGEAIGSIRENASEVARVVHDIADAMSEQGTASQEIARRVENVAQASEESNASVQHTASAIRNIREISGEMRRNVEKFRV